MDPSPLNETAAAVPVVVPQFDLFTAYFALVCMALVPVYLGSFLSLNPFDSNGDRKGETVGKSDARWFPIMGSIMLLSLYVLFKIFGKEIINIVLGIYFMVIGLFAVTSTIATGLTKFYRADLPSLFEFKKDIKIPFLEDSIISLPFALIIVLWYAKTNYWVANNIIGLSFAVQGVERVNLGGFKEAAILLSGLFVYDIFWVFGTEVMVTVAKGLEAPIKVIFPRSLWIEGAQMSLLGLGDIVIPGIFIALLLRFDRKKGEKNDIYFTVVYVAYTLALITTIAVMHVFKAAQPALLYIVPYCLGASALLALIKGEFKTLFNYSESEEEDKEKKDE